MERGTVNDNQSGIPSAGILVFLLYILLIHEVVEQIWWTDWTGSRTAARKTQHAAGNHDGDQDTERALIVRRRLKYLHARQRDYMSTYVLNTAIRRMGETPAWQPANSRQRKGMRKILKASEARMQPKRC